MAVVCCIVRQCVDMLTYIVVSSRWCPFLAPADDVLVVGWAGENLGMHILFSVWFSSL